MLHQFMKKTDKFARKTLAGVVALGMVMAVARAGAESIPQVVQVVKVEGNAQYSTDGRTWQTLHSGDVLKSGAVIRTAERSLVDVTLGEPGAAGGASAGPYLLNLPSGGGGGGAGGSGGGGAADTEKANIVRIFESTVMGVDKLTLERTGVDEVSETQLDLRAGQIMGNVTKLSAQSRYEIKLPNGVAGIRGSGYLASSVGSIVNISGFIKLAGVGPNGEVHISDIPPKHKLDAGTGQVVVVPDSEFEQYVGIFTEMCNSAAGQPGRLIVHYDITCGPTCSTDTD
jgi:hypothetical protein